MGQFQSLEIFLINLTTATQIPFPWHTAKSETPEHRATEHGTPVEHQNTDGKPESWRNTGTLAEQRNTDGKSESRWNTGTLAEQLNTDETMGIPRDGVT